LANERKVDVSKIDVTATAACLGALSCWSVGPIFIEYLTGYVDSWTQNLLRYVVACLFWLPYLAISARRGRLDRRTWRRAALPAVMNVAMQSLWAMAFYYVEPAFLVLLTKTTILWIAGFSLIFFPEERTLVRSVRFWLGLVLCVVGVVGVMYYKVDLAAARTLWGVVIGMAAALLWGAYTVSVKIAFRQIDSRSGFSVISIYTVGGLCVLGLIFGRVSACLQMGWWQWACVVISGVTAIAVGHVLYYAAIRRIGATIPSLVILAQPFTVLAISRVVFKESLNAQQIGFGLVLLAGAGLAIWAQEHVQRS